jgi:hypothetical protein
MITTDNAAALVFAAEMEIAQHRAEFVVDGARDIAFFDFPFRDSMVHCDLVCYPHGEAYLFTCGDDTVDVAYPYHNRKLFVREQGTYNMRRV